MKIFFRLIRWPLGQLILLGSWLTQPRRPKHTNEEQASLDQATKNMQLYQFKTCPFCVKTRRQIRRLGLNIETRDARNNPKWKQELTTQGGKHQVPCLRMRDKDGAVSWMYESSAINNYLSTQFG